MYYELSSNDPKDYGTIQFNSTCTLYYNKLYFRVTNLCTHSNFMITTKDDYIVIEYQNDDECVKKTYNFNDRYQYQSSSVVNDILDLFKNDLTNSIDNVFYNDSGTLTFCSKTPFKIIDASHRAKVLLGLYNSELPYSAELYSDELKQYYCEMESIPYLCLGNVLYLTSNNASVSGVNKNNKITFESICYKVIDFIHPGVPLISKLQGQNVNISPEDLSKMKFTLVDFQFHPVILKAPLFITLFIDNSEKLISFS